MPEFDLETRNLINFFSQTPEMFCLLSGPEHLFTYVNEAHIRVLGFNATGKKVREAQPESVEVHGILDDVYRTGKTAHLKRIAVTVGKSLRYFDLTYAAKKNEAGEISGIMILGSEITDVVLAEKRIRETEEKLQLALNASSMGLWSVNLETLDVTASASLLRILGVSSLDEGLETIMAKIHHPDDKEHFKSAWVQAVTERRPFTKDYRIIRPSGEIRWLTSIGSAHYDEKGNPVSFSGVSIDITEIKLTEQKLKSALKFRDDFLSVASHELKTPLTGLKLQVQSALRKMNKGTEFSPADISTLLLKNNFQVDRLVRLVDDMLDLSRIQSGRLTFSFRKELLNPVIREAFELFRDQFENAGTTLTLELTEDAATGVFDQERIAQVLTNLLSNALKYGAQRPVRILVTKKRDEAIVAITDQGMGISKENLGKIFRKFERAVTPSEVSGLGIGLYISREIMEAHGGKIWVESEVGKGSTFFLCIPLTE